MCFTCAAEPSPTTTNGASTMTVKPCPASLSFSSSARASSSLAVGSAKAVDVEIARQAASASFLIRSQDARGSEKLHELATQGGIRVRCNLEGALAYDRYVSWLV